MLGVGSGVHIECNTGAVFGNVHGCGCCLSSRREKISPKLLGWCAGGKSVGSTWSGEALCVFALYSSTEVGMSGSSNVASKVAARSICSFESFGVSHQQGVKCEVPSESLWGVCWQGEIGQKGAPACVVAHKCLGWDETEIPDPALVSWVCVHVACDGHSEVRALATEAVLIKLESPLCNVDGFG